MMNFGQGNALANMYRRPQVQLGVQPVQQQGGFQNMLMRGILGPQQQRPQMQGGMTAPLQNAIAPQPAPLPQKQGGFGMDAIVAQLMRRR